MLSTNSTKRERGRGDKYVYMGRVRWKGEEIGGGSRWTWRRSGEWGDGRVHTNQVSSKGMV